MEQRSCVHFDKSFNLDKLLKKIQSCKRIKCGDCKEGVRVKRRSEGKVNNNWRRNRFSSSGPKSAKKAIWLCLECGYYICGGVGLPTGAQSHVARHIRLTRHRLVIQCENPQLRWCFPCQSLLPFEKEENGERKDLLLKVVKLIKQRSSNTYSAEDSSCSRSGSVITGARDGYAVRGLVNLGNTCFFNSVLQNLLSLDQLGDRLLEEDLSGGGPLVSSLKRLFAETKSEAGLFNSVINPRELFDSVCSKAPQFRGYQQQDSHELLRCLLDDLSNEESSLRNKLGVSDIDDTSSHQKPTLIDSVFGGEISSTVSCLECGHSSKVYEPFLDLSLPVPSKKFPPNKQQNLSEEKNGELPPKKVHKNSEMVSVIALDNKQVPEIATQTNTDFDSFWLDIIGPETSHSNTDLVWQGNICDKEDARAMQSNKETSASGIFTEIDEAQVCGSYDSWLNSPSANPWGDEELPLVVSDSQVLCMPYKDDINYDDKTVAEVKVMKRECEASSSFVSGDHHEQNVVDYVDFSGFFDEPEISAETVLEPPSKAKCEAPSSFISGDHEQNVVDCADLIEFFDEPEISEGSVFGPPCKAECEASSSFVSGHYEQNVEDYGDFSWCFDKPEISEKPVFGPPSKAKCEDYGDFSWCFDEPEMSENPVFGPPSKAKCEDYVSSNSDPEVVDDSGSPVSVDSCLDQFTKAEVLSEDNAWHCENCSKNLKLQRMREKGKTKEGLKNGWVTENGASFASDECGDNSSNSSSIDLENRYKAAPITESPNCKDEEKVIRDGMIIDSDTKQSPIASSATETPILGGETITSQPDNGNESEKREDEAVDSEEVIVKRDATKRVLVNKAPPVLTIHLKRFSQDARGRLSKLSGHVDFKEFIDLGQYMDYSRWTEEDQPVYRLTGLVEHSGTMGRGHYVAYIRGGDKEWRNSDIQEHNSSTWYRASDTYVRRVSFEEVLRSEAYILFYQRI
ncbi:unnamed protein product [Thlaspi arvense]|uniref:Ubiquitin carboxyl-terminal hydrolase n=1 Tax=Thlaspi arvense TaxID=13288 RepID=A0AAU9SC44_THLAR|nr:unnamed protein product [Thlaspi arvense]